MTEVQKVLFSFNRLDEVQRTFNVFGPMLKTFRNGLYQQIKDMIKIQDKIVELIEKTNDLLSDNIMQISVNDINGTVLVIKELNNPSFFEKDAFWRFGSD